MNMRSACTSRFSRLSVSFVVLRSYTEDFIGLKTLDEAGKVTRWGALAVIVIDALKTRISSHVPYRCNRCLVRTSRYTTRRVQERELRQVHA